MYDTHVPLIAAAMRASPDTFARGCMFAILSARAPFYRVPSDLLDLDRDKHNCRALWAWKGAA